jgi:hypothetical protein
LINRLSKIVRIPPNKGAISQMRFRPDHAASDRRSDIPDGQHYRRSVSADHSGSAGYGANVLWITVSHRLCRAQKKWYRISANHRVENVGQGFCPAFIRCLLLFPAPFFTKVRLMKTNPWYKDMTLEYTVQDGAYRGIQDALRYCEKSV